ncbi:hypothetical protein L1887_55245 [Cichorium endivia]|nr:hypothetical protein L1887_55245 [Cichorium endivia]
MHARKRAFDKAAKMPQKCGVTSKSESPKSANRRAILNIVERQEKLYIFPFPFLFVFLFLLAAAGAPRVRSAIGASRKPAAHESSPRARSPHLQPHHHPQPLPRLHALGPLERTSHSDSLSPHTHALSANTQSQPRNADIEMHFESG